MLRKVSLFLAVGWTLWTEPFAFRFGRETDAGKVEPLDGTLKIKRNKIIKQSIANEKDKDSLRRGCRIQSSRHRRLGGRDSKWARWGRQACRVHQPSGQCLSVQKWNYSRLGCFQQQQPTQLQCSSWTISSSLDLLQLKWNKKKCVRIIQHLQL